MAFVKGQSGNPAGAKKGAKHGLGEAMVRELQVQFAQHGKAAIEHLATTDPKAFLEVCVKVLPKEINVSGNVDHNHSVTVAAERVDDIVAALSHAGGEARDVSEAVH